MQACSDVRRLNRPDVDSQPGFFSKNLPTDPLSNIDYIRTLLKPKNGLFERFAPHVLELNTRTPPPGSEIEPAAKNF